jgi:uncharacterized ferredoxin-like protein
VDACALSAKRPKAMSLDDIVGKFLVDPEAMKVLEEAREDLEEILDSEDFDISLTFDAMRNAVDAMRHVQGLPPLEDVE